MRVRGDIWALIVLLATGALLRVLYLSELGTSPGALIPSIDASYHDYWARGLAWNHWDLPPQTADPQIQSTPFFRPPGYPYFLAFIYWLTHGNPIAVRMFQMALGLFSAWLAYVMGRRWFGRRMGLIFCGLVATYWGLIYFEGDLLEPSLLVALLLLLVNTVGHWAHQATLLNVLGAGVLMGFLALVRPNLLLMVPAILGWAYWIRQDWRSFAKHALGFLFAIILAISPATIRNFRVAKDFVPISSNAGINLFLGNHAGANGVITPTVPDIGELGTSFDYPQLVRAAEAKVGRSLQHSEASAYFGALAYAYIWAHPVETLKLTFKKALLFWGPREVGNNKEDELERENSRILQSIPGNFASSAALFLLGLIAFVYRWKQETIHRRQVGTLIAVCIAMIFLSYLPYFAAGRFRMPMVPLLLFFGAFFLDKFFDGIKARRWQVVGMWLVAGSASYAVASQNLAGYEPLKDKWHFDRGVGLARSGQVLAAIKAYQAALEIQPTHTHAAFNLGALLESKGQLSQAEDHYKRALALHPNFSLAHYALAELFTKQGRHDEAIKTYQDAIRLHPGNAHAHNNLAVLLFIKGDNHAAWREVELCRQLGGNPAAEFVETLQQKLKN